MTQPPGWGPPGHDVPSDPTIPLPTVTRPAAPRPTAPYPTRRQAPFPPPADRDDHGGGYRDDDRNAYRDDPRDDRSAYRDDDRRARSPARPRSRGQVFAGVVLVLALVVSALLGVLIYQLLASVDLFSADPLGGLEGPATTLGAVALGAVVVFVLAVIALVIARPKVLAGLGLAASLLLPVGAVMLGVMYGGAVLRQNVESDIAAGGAAVSAEGAAAAEAVIQELERRGLDAGPLRDLIIQVAGQGG
jgi:hypothetical protein